MEDAIYDFKKWNPPPLSCHFSMKRDVQGDCELPQEMNSNMVPKYYEIGKRLMWGVEAQIWLPQRTASPKRKKVHLLSARRRVALVLVLLLKRHISCADGAPFHNRNIDHDPV